MIRFMDQIIMNLKTLLICSVFLVFSSAFAEDTNMPPSLSVSSSALNSSTQSGSTGAPTSAASPVPPIEASAAQVNVGGPVGNTEMSVPGAPAPAQVDLIDPTLFGTTQDPAFQNMTTKMFPMTPEQIAALRQVYESTQNAISTPATSPKPMLSSQTVPLSPGSVPPVIRLATGYVSSVLFLDETGMPWPITSYNMGDPKSFNVQWDQESNMLMIQGQGPYATGNMAVTLENLNTPMMFTLVSDQRVVDYRVDFRVQGRGPKAAAMMNANAAQNGSALLMNLLDGVAPQDARPLEVVGGSGQAWLRGNTLFLRTPLTVLSPSYDATMSSADGTRVYQMNATPLVLVSDRGRSTTITIKGL